MVNLVELHKTEITCDSQLVAKKFGYKHNEIVKIANKLVLDLEDLREVSNLPYFEIIEKEYRGNKFKAYVMSREFFSLL